MPYGFFPAPSSAPPVRPVLRPNSLSVAAAQARNVVNICIPAALDPSMAPPGKASAHVYYAANEPYDDWATLERGSAAYKALKEERSQARRTPARACLAETD